MYLNIFLFKKKINHNRFIFFLNNILIKFIKIKNGDINISINYKFIFILLKTVIYKCHLEGMVV